MREYIVFSGKEHYNSLGIVRTLGEAGIRPVFVAVKGEFKFVGQSKYVKKKHYVDDVEQGIRLILKEYGNCKEKSFILVEDDWTMFALDRYYDSMKEHFYFFNAHGNLKKFLDKDVLNEVAQRHGLQIPKTWKVKNGDIPDNIVYPIMTKAINSIGSEWKNIVFICNNQEELRNAYQKIKSEKILLQQYIEKIDEISFDAFSVDYGKDVFFVMEANQIFNIPDKYSPYWMIKNSENKEIQDIISGIIKEIGFEGIFEFEFMKDKDGNLWFLEINFRNTALGFATTVAGMPQVVYWCESIEKGFIDKEKYYKKISEGFTAMAECFDYDARVKTGMITKKEWKKQYRSAECKMYKGRNDNIPFYLFMWYKLTKMKH